MRHCLRAVIILNCFIRSQETAPGIGWKQLLPWLPGSGIIAGIRLADLLPIAVINNSITYSVSELTQLIKQSLENQFPTVWVSGEISNFIHHRSGHMYFTLKDQKSEIKAVVFKGNNLYLPFQPENGMQVLLQGRLAVYEQRGYYQIIGTRMEPAGTGTLYLAFEALKKKLLAEGLFADELKQPLPPYP
ncbi:MAG: exodeoxyribonuclease VII large subunit, partial [Candidatus Marinimicrobia bacterium]|nr:exodeoxyribonuclease VII large subunit [Candidatus Neomarinimicrobiota bacterium]